MKREQQAIRKMIVAPATYYGDPSIHLEQQHEQERSCRVCIYNARRLNECLQKRTEYPSTGEACPKFKHRHR